MKANFLSFARFFFHDARPQVELIAGMGAAAGMAEPGAPSRFAALTSKFIHVVDGCFTTAT
jgi:hypothetical protein